ncbi:hypothetical protein TcBrA4_0080310 [Trypanosoma cruzi]|nr:hypothetical protein TcBrA4_0080310 [Trypanosoma cruzi]
MKNSVVRTQPTRRYENFTLENNLPLCIGANFHDDPICFNTLRKSHNLLLHPKVDYAPHTEYIYNGGGLTRDGKKRTQTAVDEESDDEDVFNGWTIANLMYQTVEKIMWFVFWLTLLKTFPNLRLKQP